MIRVSQPTSSNLDFKYGTTLLKITQYMLAKGTYGSSCNVNIIIDPYLEIDVGMIKRSVGTEFKKLPETEENEDRLLYLLNEQNYDMIIPNPNNDSSYEMWVKSVIHEFIHLEQLNSGQLKVTARMSTDGPVEDFEWNGEQVPNNVIELAESNHAAYMSLPWELDAWDRTPKLYKDFISWIEAWRDSEFKPPRGFKP
jgi:hypothetical protein